jgi:hypothetical protein
MVDDVNELFELFKATYGDDSAYRQRWNYEYEKNPHKDQIKIIIAESDGRFVGATTRLPFQIRWGKRIIDTAFSVNSMVHPQFRRMGIMDNLYHKGAEIFEILFSKGTAPGMFKLLIKMGYRTVLPDSNLTAVLSPVKWFLWKLKYYKKNIQLKDIDVNGYGEFVPIRQFGQEFNTFVETNPPVEGWVEVVKNDKYMNWRYLDNPLKSYKAFYHLKNGKIQSVIVISSIGITGNIVDIKWDHTAKDEPKATLKFAKKYLKMNGIIKVKCWSVNTQFRTILMKNGFFSGRTAKNQNLSMYSNNSEHELFSSGLLYAFVDGDGDVEYLS